MCVANLILTNQSCSHRWYQLVRPCDPSNDLSNCPAKLRLEGWESRVDHCPFCSTSSTSEPRPSTHRLFGTTSSASSMSSPTDPFAMALRRTSSTRRGSIASSPSGSTTPMSPISRQSTGGSGASGYFAPDVDRGQRSRDMNDRILMYLSSEPHQVLPSGKKHYPTYPSVMESAEESGAATTASSFSDERSGLGKTKGKLTRGWKRMSASFTMKNV